ncbi:MAG: alkaline phosphatase [bacterium]|nr:alkaline phosphatase [bacterium]
MSKSLSIISVLTLCLGLALPVAAGDDAVELDTSFYTPATDLDNLPLLAGDEIDNVILLIGDGMGLAHTFLTRVVALGAGGRLNLERMPVTGIVNTHSLDALVTDSAAAGTAMATGHKTGNRIVSQLPDGQLLTTILERARDHGLATGMVVTSRITHATPACFGGHDDCRDHERDLALQIAQAEIDVLLGGGRDYWLPVNAEHSARRDRHDLVARMNKSGYAVVFDREEMNRVRTGRLFGLFRYCHLDSRDTVNDPTLAEMTAKTLELLDQDVDGFFLMVEGSQIDWYGHDNDAAGIVYETLCFDLAVAEALRFARADGRTLVLVTADHETGGLTVPKGQLDGGGVKPHFGTTHHTGSPVPIYAFGPGALRFTGVLDNTEVHDHMLQLLRLE